MLFDLESYSCFLPMKTMSRNMIWWFIIFGRFLTAPFLLFFTRLSNFRCPLLLCHRKLSSTWLILHYSSFSRIYTLFGVLTTVPTSFPKYFLPISHFFESNIHMCHWSHVWLTLRILGFRSSTSNTFSTLILLLIAVVPLPIILEDKLSSKVTFMIFS